MIKRIFTISFLIITIGNTIAQQVNKVPHRNLLEAKNAIELQQIYDENIQAELKYAKEVLGLSIEPIYYKNGTVIQLVGVEQNGMPKYIKTDNTGAAKTIGTDKVNPGGSLGLSLSGSGMTNRLGVWDGGAVRLTHQEFQGRAVQTDGQTTAIDHATHVAGTMVAGGVSASAKGMAFQAPIKCYDWNNDNSEMTAAAAAGMLISNHSYGSICGWDYDDVNLQWRWYGNTSVSSTEDLDFGLYDTKSQQWDQMVYNNPFYLPFKSAGNDRGDAPSGSEPRVYFDNNNGVWTAFTGAVPPADGQYDCITTYGNAKNIMTLGAVNKISNGWTSASSVVMSSFSGWGPTDDGRIKPDICAAGVNLNSCYSASNTAYGSSSGTSMSCPNASGSALLIQQHFNNLNNRFLRASTLKGLIIHTADEAGTNIGPDYSFGWGLMNTAKAVQAITDSNTNNIIENQITTTLTPYTRTVVSGGLVPLKVTLCWTDVAASASSSSVLDNPTSKLVNDLDVRLIRQSDNQEFFPYILNPATPNAAATTGDNFRDNVEQILIATPTAGLYTVRITSKRALANNTNQIFSLIIGGISSTPRANFTSSTQNTCANSNITFTNTSSNATSIQWYFPGGVPATSTAANPIVSYPTIGKYSVALKITNIAGTDSIYKTNFISVGGMALPLIETFENNSSTVNSWRIINSYSDTFGWKKYSIVGTSPGNIAMGTNNYDNIITGKRYQLITPLLDLRGMQSASLDFQHAYTRYALNDKDSLVVSISTNCGATWIRLYGAQETRPNSGSKLATFTRNGEPNQLTSTLFFTPSSINDWCSSNVNSTNCNNISLNSYVGLSSVQIRFESYCGSGNNLYIDNVNITGTPFTPKAGFISPASVCSNQNFTLTDTSLNNPNNWLWTITGPESKTSTLKNPVFSLTAPGLYNVKLRVNNITGNDSVIVTNAFEVKSTPANPTVSLTGSLAICDNDSTILTTNGTNLQWYKDSVAINGQTNAIFSNKQGGKIAVRTTINGCSAQSTIYNFETGTRPPVAIVTKSLTGNVFCDGGSFTLSSSAATNNQWTNNGIDIPSQTNTSFNYNDSGVFAVKVFNGVCFSTSIPIAIAKIPRPVTSEIKESRKAYKNDTTVYSVIGTENSTFTWTASGGNIQSGQNTNTVVVLWSTGNNGVVQVSEKGLNGCVAATKTLPVGIWNTSVNSIKNESEFVIYPNPANNFIQLKYIGKALSNVEVKIFDILGKNVLTKNVNLTQSDEQTIDISSLPKGIYVIKILGNDFSSSKLITKE